MTKPLKSVKPGIPPAAIKFLRFLDPNAVDFGEPFAFQTYDDLIKRKDPSRARTYIGTLDQHAATLADANMNGCAIHVTINDCSDKARRAANVVRVRKHFCEIDGNMTLPEILALGEMVELPIAWINESSPGKFHLYWNVAVDVAADLEGFTQRQKKLAKLFNAGRESVDVSRVLRVPGYWHQKGEAFQVRTVYQNPKAPDLDRFQFFTALSDVEVDDDAATIRDAEHEEDQIAIDAAIAHFKTYPTAISDTPNGPLGKKGNSTTYDAIVIARDKGVDEPTNLELALEHYNPRCDPQWSYEQLATIVANAYQYGKNKQGARHPLVEADQDFAGYENTPEDDAWINAQIAANVTATRQREIKAAAAPGIGHNSNGLAFLDVEKVPLQNVDYIWKGRLARGKHTVIAGEAGEGKSQMLANIAATISTGGEWPDGGRAPKGKVIILSAEDDPNDTLIPRLIAAGADLTQVKILKSTSDGKKFNLERDLEKLREACKSLGNVALIAIDPVSSYMGGTLDGKANIHIRHVLDPLSDLAADLRCAILSITHFRKAAEGPKAIHRIMDSIAFGAAPRAAFACMRDPNDTEGGKVERRVFLLFKTNLPHKAKGLAYHIEAVTAGKDHRDGKPIETLKIKWDGATDLTADAVQRMENERRAAPRMDEAIAFVRRALAEGERPVADVQRDADAAGVSYSTLRRALTKLGVKARIREGTASQDAPGIWEYPRIEGGDDGAGDFD